MNEATTTLTRAEVPTTLRCRTTGAVYVVFAVRVFLGFPRIRVQGEMLDPCRC